MPTIKQLAAAMTIPNKDALIDALAKAGYESIVVLKNYNGDLYLNSTMATASANTLLDECTAHDAEVKPGPAYRTSLAVLLAELFPKDPPPQGGNVANGDPATATEKERKEAEAFGTQRYTSVGLVTLSRIRAIDRFEGKIVKRLYDELNKGTLSRDSIVLTGLKRAITSEAEKRSSIGGLTVTICSETDEQVQRNGEFLIAVYRYGKLMLAAGMMPIAASAANPTAASLGDKGVLTVPDRSPGAQPGATKLLRYHVTPESVEQYLLAAMRGANTMKPTELLAAHEALHEKIIDDLQTGYNYDTAMHRVMEKHTFASVLPTGDANRGNGGNNNNTQLLKELQDLRTSHKALQNKFMGLSGGSSFKRDANGTPTKKSTCHSFQKGLCTRGSTCKFAHTCELCGADDHGSATCPKK